MNVLVTGSSRGIGKAIALKYASSGYNVAINCSKDIDALYKVRDEIEGYGVRCAAIVADVGDPEECERMFDKITSFLGPVDVLINNAGISYVGLIQEMTFDEWEKVISSDLSSVFYCTKLALPEMIRNQSGKIINISSVWGNVGASCEAAYSAAKGGVNALTRALAKELAPSNIQVNAIACGLIDTLMNAQLSKEDKEELLDDIPAGRMGTPEEVADLVFQISEANGYLTGQIITIDGAWI